MSTSTGIHCSGPEDHRATVFTNLFTAKALLPKKVRDFLLHLGPHPLHKGSARRTRATGEATVPATKRAVLVANSPRIIKAKEVRNLFRIDRPRAQLPAQRCLLCNGARPRSLPLVKAKAFAFGAFAWGGTNRAQGPPRTLPQKPWAEMLLPLVCPGMAKGSIPQKPCLRQQKLRGVFLKRC